MLRTETCLPTFYISKVKFNLCLIVKYGLERSIFEWENCNNNGRAQRWVKVASRDRPGMIQICHANGQNKCLIASNQTDGEIENSVMLENYQSTAKVSKAQLWKWNNNQSNQIMNVGYITCLADVTVKKSSRLWLFTTQCEENEVPFLGKQWDLKPIMDERNSRVCADFQIPHDQTTPSRSKRIDVETFFPTSY